VKIAITADVHLTSREKNPERFHALENILEQLVTLKIDNLIIAGDLFDATCKDPGVFEQLIKKEKYSQITFYIIPGNHDPVLSQGTFVMQNIKYLTETQLIKFSKDANFLLLPYTPGTSIGEALASFPGTLASGAWFLVAHGDNLESTRLRNNYESGLYMPLSGRDIQLYKPKKVFLGHIHVKMDSEIVHYPGSPCGLDPTEIGIRSFLVYDISDGKVERIPVETDVIYLQELITVLPMQDEETYIKQLLTKKITAWNLDENQKMKARVRIKTQGYSTNREKISKTIKETMDQYQYTLGEPPDLSKLMLSADVMRADIASAVQARILELGLVEDPDEPTKDEYILSAMNQIYKG
jgi:DNA repair exonuclease SbcCD nuclease subunit